jgi:hypothetical protein
MAEAHRTNLPHVDLFTCNGRREILPSPRPHPAIGGRGPLGSGTGMIVRVKARSIYFLAGTNGCT